MPEECFRIARPTLSVFLYIKYAPTNHHLYIHLLYRKPDPQDENQAWSTRGFIPTALEPQREKMYLPTCPPNEDSNQTAHSHSLVSLRCPHEVTLTPWLSEMHPVKILIANAQADLNLPCLKVRFLTLRLIYVRF